MSSAAALSIAMIAAIALVVGALVLWHKGGARLKVVLMLLLAAVMLANIAIWTIPSTGAPPLVSATGAG